MMDALFYLIGIITGYLLYGLIGRELGGETFK